LKKFAKIALNHKIEEVVEIEEEVIWALGWDFESHFWAEFWLRFWGPFLHPFWSILNRGFACFTGLFRFRRLFRTRFWTPFGPYICPCFQPLWNPTLQPAAFHTLGRYFTHPHFKLHACQHLKSRKVHKPVKWGLATTSLEDV
jgi:hypothetical protein